MAHESGNPLRLVIGAEVHAQRSGFGNFSGKLHKPARGFEGAHSGPTEKQPADQAHVAERGIDHQQHGIHVDLPHLRQSMNDVAGKRQRDEREQKK